MQGRLLVGRALSTATVLLVALGGAGCSGDAAPSGIAHPVATAVGQLQDAFEDGDAAAICTRMTKEAQKQAGEIAHGDPTTCERDLRRAFRIFAEGGWSAKEKPIVVDVDVAGARATARVDQESSWQADVELTKENGIWKLAGFFGIPPREFLRFEKDLRSFPFREFSSVPLDILDGEGKPCPDVHDRRHPKVTGGCIFRVSGKSVPIRILTPFGDFEFGECKVTYRVAVSPWGHAWTNQMEVSDVGDQRNGCSDINPCVVENGWEERPWTGHFDVEEDGGYTHNMLMCLRTCVGLFGGEFVMRLVRDGKGWKVEPSEEGDTGFKLDGELAVTGAPFDLRSGG